MEARRKTRQQGEWLARLHAVSVALGDVFVQSDAARVVVEQSVQAMSASLGVVALLTPDGTELEIIGQTGYDEPLVRFPLKQGCPAYTVIRTGRPLFFVSAQDLASQHPAFAASYNFFTGGSAWLPLIIRAETIGILGLGFAGRRQFGDADITFMLMLSQQCAQALERARLYETEHQARVAAEDAERHLMQVLETVPEPVFIADAQTGRFVFANQASQRVLGVDVTGQEVSTKDRHFLAPRRPDGTPVRSLDMPTQRALFRGETVRGEELAVHHFTEDRDVWVRLYSAPLLDAEGKIYGAVTAFQDITAIRDLERQRTAVLATISHDLLNPLAAANLRTQLLKRGVAKLPPDENRRLLSNIEELEGSVRSTVQQAEELKDLIALQYGRSLNLRQKEIDLVSLVRGAAREQEVETSRIQVEITESEIRGYWDESRLGRVFTNLLNNALKYSSPESKVLVRMHTELDEKGFWAVVRVLDQGIGIPAAEQSRLFEPFYRASNVSPNSRGSGLGLAGAQQIVQQHGGSISVESEEGKGSIFTVRLPLR